MLSKGKWFFIADLELNAKQKGNKKPSQQENEPAVHAGSDETPYAGCTCRLWWDSLRWLYMQGLMRLLTLALALGVQNPSRREKKGSHLWLLSAGLPLWSLKHPRWTSFVIVGLCSPQSFSPSIFIYFLFITVRQISSHKPCRFISHR